MGSDSDKKYIAFLSLLLGVFVFVCSLEGLKNALKIVSGELMASLLSMIERHVAPLTGLALGILSTSLVQSSSAVVATTMVSMAGLVAGGLPLSSALSFGIPMVLGANIGTTITNTIVAVGVKKGMTSKEFNATVPGVIIDDIFKYLNVGFFFTLEVTTGFLSKTVAQLTDFLLYAFQLETFFATFEKSIVEIFITGPIINPISEIFGEFLGIRTGGVILFVLWFLGIIFALSLLEKSLHALIDLPRFEKSVLAAFKSPFRSFATGLGVTFMVGSSSVGTSLIIPFLATSMIKLENAYPYILGCAIGTTVDLSQIYGYIAGGVVGMSLGLAHMLFNVFGVMIWWLLPLRVVPLKIARKIGGFITSHRQSYLLLLAFVAIIYFIIPLAIIFLL